MLAHVPAVDWITGYRRSWLRADLIGGLSAGAVVIPQAMAYATIAGMPVQVGLYTCLVPMAGYALFGGSRAMSFSTTSTIAVLTATTMAGAGLPSSPQSRTGDLATLVFLVGAVLLAARAVHLANLVENISDALLTGLKVGVGLTVAVGQLPKLFGISPPPQDDKFFGSLGHDLAHLSDTSLVTLALGVASVAALLAMKRWSPRVPGALIAVAGGIAVAWVASLDEHGVALTTRVPSGLPAAVVPNFQHTGQLLPGAVAIALMAYLETVSVARNLRLPEEPAVDNNQELLANGVATFAGAFFQALPSAGGFSQSAVNRGAGARSQLSAFATIVLAILVALFLAPVLSHLPQATLAALVIVATLGLVSIPELVALARFDRLELVVALGAGAVALVSGLLVSVAVGVGLTIAIVLHELNKVPVSELGRRDDGVVAPGAPELPGLLILRLGAPLYTANARTAVDRVLEWVDGAARPIKVVLLDAQTVGGLSMTIIAQGRELQRALTERGIELWLSSLPDRALQMARAWPGWQDAPVRERLFATSTDGVRAYLDRPESPSTSNATITGDASPG